MFLKSYNLRNYLAILFVFSASVLAKAQDIQPIPDLWARVTDLTETLNTDEKQNLEAYLANLEQEKGSQIAVLIVPTTMPEPIEDYSIRVVEQWKLGREGVDDGVLLLIAKNDRKLRIEVGYGLEGAITDAQAKRIIEDYITPNFKQGNFIGGINEGVNAISQLIIGEELPEATQRSSGGDGANEAWYYVIFLASVVVGGLSRKKFGKWKGIGLGTGLAFLLSFIFYGLIASVFMTIFFFIISSVSGSGSGGGHYGGGYSGGSSSGGGFSGGGGSFGGGGASGGW